MTRKSDTQQQKSGRIGSFGIVAVIVSVLCVVGIFYLGHLQIRSVLQKEGDLIAMAWYENMRHSESGVAGLVDGTSPALNDDLLGSFGIDALAVIRRDGSVETLHGRLAATEAELKPALEASGLPRADRRSTIVIDHSSFLSPVTATWVVFPSMPGGGQLAVRFDQRLEALDLSNSFKSQLVYLSGIAVVTFFSFMAGFTYRTRQMQREKQDLVYLAMHDELTGLANRKHFEQRLAEALEDAEEQEHKTGLLILDLDGFKAVNDTLGHPVGDNLLRATAERLKNSLREEDLLCRLAGDEFAVIVPVVQDVSALRALAERMLRLIEQPFRIDGQEIQIGCSIGMTIGPDNGEDVKTLIRNADFALYRAKGGGRRTWRFFDPKMAEDQRSRETLEDGLRYAIQNELFTILYQPQHDLKSGDVVCYEALLRWKLPSKNLVPTSMFLSVAEETGLIIPMGEWVIRQVARDLNVLPPEARIAINLSAAQLQRDGTDTYIAEALASADVEPGRLEIEVNESILGRGEKAAFTRLEGLREAGISIVLDNFGVGTSSLGLVSRYPFDKIKLDRTFLARIEDPKKASAVVGAICNLGRSLGMVVVGEGVETVEHRDILASCGCNLGQGYYFGHPVTLEEVVGEIARTTANRAQASLAAGDMRAAPAEPQSGQEEEGAAARPVRLAASA
ncbi:bifunctional diguanylate cyclase/phosphodiesterase [Afifella sp. IM 167]|uniref:putative bifunctional diguanylate cyclase/phosphodiesterase n=1 Tax=Afifella sp. IM 167 TaxID=2033586 RepID=UPI001CCAFB35|nr:EAL domain-containing protein [Afifella sp. IM 167]